MTTVETTSLGNNVRGNNNICWRNLSILGGGESHEGVVMLSNYTSSAQLFRTRIQLDQTSPVPLPPGALELVASPTLMNRWIAGGRIAFGLQPSAATPNVFDVLQDGAWMGNLAMAPGEHLVYRLRAHETLRTNPAANLRIDVLQELEGPVQQVIGGQQFVVRAGTSMWPAATTTFGESCIGSISRPRNHPLTAAVLGTTWQGEIANVDQFALVLMSVSRLTPPLPLDVLGAPGCWQQLPADVTLLALANGSRAAYSQPIPNSPAFVGMTINTQGAVFAPAANALGFTTTNAIGATILP